ncbi:MAG TPA: hypothetical protein VKU01_08005 [Bryobacteraceae bacterium]|nr:hypothetical protein [Bryobacteraceae bacterium]
MHTEPLGRRGFMRTALTGAAGALAVEGADEHSPAALPPGQLFSDPEFAFTTQIGLGASYYGTSNPGKLFSIATRIKDGDFESAYQAYHDAGLEARRWAEAAASKGHRISARDAWLWAASYFSLSMRFLDGTQDSSRLSPTFQEYENCWEQAAALFHPAVERVAIPYENTTLTGWFFRADDSRRRRPLVILNNGADGSDLSMYVLGAAGGIARGYNCLTFNGPGQNDSLWLKKLYFRPDWEKVITPVVDFAIAHPEVDPKRIALIGISQGGYWAPRALAFEHRIAAGVADPGVTNVAEVWIRNLPKPLVDLLHDGKREQFDAMMSMGVKFNPRSRMVLSSRMRPFGMSSYYDVYAALADYSLKNVAAQIRCPMLITNPESEQFFAGQPRQLRELLTCPKKLVDFTRAQGADLHCEVNAPGYRDYQIYNWLDETLTLS